VAMRPPGMRHYIRKKFRGWFSWPQPGVLATLSWGGWRNRRRVPEKNGRKPAAAHPHTMLARRLGCPVRVLHAMDDEVIDYLESVEALKLLSANAELLITKTGGHRLIGYLDKVARMAVDLASTD
jgi:pimeloyl-ACP methyl ester carboxylesterase